MPRLILVSALAVLIGLDFSSPATAMDATCRTLANGQAKALKLPVHIFLTETETFSSASFAKAAAGIGVGGTKKSEEISTGHDVYVLQNGKWIDMQMNLAEMSKTKEADDPDSRKIHDAERCKTLADEMVAGQSANVYQTSNPELGIDTKLWIAKSSGLPLKSETTNTQGPMRSFTVATYDYKAVPAPIGAIPLKQAVESGRKH